MPHTCGEKWPNFHALHCSSFPTKWHEEEWQGLGKENLCGPRVVLTRLPGARTVSRCQGSSRAVTSLYCHTELRAPPLWHPEFPTFLGLKITNGGHLNTVKGQELSGTLSYLKTSEYLSSL